MQLIYSRTTMLAREASSREEELVAMKVVELKEGAISRSWASVPRPSRATRRGCAVVSEYRLESADGDSGE